MGLYIKSLVIGSCSAGLIISSGVTSYRILMVTLMEVQEGGRTRDLHVDKECGRKEEMGMRSRQLRPGTGYGFSKVHINHSVAKNPLGHDPRNVLL